MANTHSHTHQHRIYTKYTHIHQILQNPRWQKNQAQDLWVACRAAAQSNNKYLIYVAHPFWVRLIKMNNCRTSICRDVHMVGMRSSCVDRLHTYRRRRIDRVKIWKYSLRSSCHVQRHLGSLFPRAHLGLTTTLREIVDPPFNILRKQAISAKNILKDVHKLD